MRFLSVARSLFIAFVSGGILMSLEMVAFRLYAPYFGYSIYVWGTMICVVMLALAAGYSLGGRLADSARPDTHLFSAIVAAAGWQLLILFVLRPLLTALAERGEVAGVVLATLAIFAPPMICLAAAGPILIRLCAAEGRVGWAAGAVYALSTAGGMLGIIVTIFWLLPRFGTQTTLRSLCAATFVLAASTGAKRMIAFAPILILPFVPTLGWAEGTVWTAESAYNLVRVLYYGPDLVLTLNQPSSVQTITAAGYYYDFFAEGPRLVPARRALVLGMGGGVGIRALRKTAPNIDIDAVEIDPRVVEAAVRFFGVANVRVHTADARRWLAQNREKFDIVQLDVYQGGPYIPFYLVTDEFFRLTRDHMTPDALLMVNVFDESADGKILNAIAATLRREFPSVMMKRTGPVNSMLYAFSRKRPVEEFVPPPGSPVLTDDRAPIEELTRAMLGH